MMKLGMNLTILLCQNQWLVNFRITMKTPKPNKHGHLDLSIIEEKLLIMCNYHYELTKNDKDILAVLSEHVSLISDANTLRDEIEEQSTLLREWMKWADMGIEDLLPKWCAPVLRATYEKTRSILNRTEKNNRSSKDSANQ
jgi:hypothetical protein